MTWSGILVYAENYSGKVNPAAFELLNKASELRDKIGGKIHVVTLAIDGEHLIARELIARGADRVVVYKVQTKEELANYLLHRDAIIHVISECRPRLVLISATPWGRSLGPRVATRLQTGITADCLDLYINELSEIIQVRPAFTGNIIAYIKTITSPVIATVRPMAFSPSQPDYSREGEVDIRPISGIKVSDDTPKLNVLGQSRPKRVLLSEAQVILAVGRGLRDRGDIKLFEELASEIGGELACSKPLVDLGWMERDRQVGFSGSIVRPKVYIACGISGAPQHIAGMKDSSFIVAINTDESAPISKYCDLFIIGDMYSIALKVLTKIREVKRGNLRGVT